MVDYQSHLCVLEQTLYKGIDNFGMVFLLFQLDP